MIYKWNQNTIKVMKIILLMVISFFSIYLNGQPLQKEWVNTIPGSLYEQTSSMALAPCGDLYVVGFFQEYFGSISATGGEDGFVAKFSQNGNLIWINQFNGSSVDRLNGIAVQDDNQIYIVGEFKGTVYYNNDSLVSQNEMDLILVKIDSSGTIQWANAGGGLGYESANDICLSENGNLCVTGYFENDLNIDTTTIQGNGLRDIFIATFDQMGNLIWLRSIGGPAFEDGRAIVTDNIDNIYITGAFRDLMFLPGNDTLFGVGSYDAYVAKIDKNGILQWIKTMGGAAADEGVDINVDANQDIYAVGWYDRSMIVDSITLNGEKEEDGYIIKFDVNGNVLWSSSLAGEFDERVYAVDFDASNNVYIMGTLDSVLILGADTLYNRHFNRPTDIFITKFDQYGTCIWAQDFGYDYNDFGFDLLVQNSNTLYLTGSFQDTTIFIQDTIMSQYGYDVFIAKFNIDTTVAIQKFSGQVTKDLIDLQIIPNPSKISTNICFTVTEPTDIKISLSDVYGKVVQSFLFKDMNIGTHLIPLFKQNNQNGVYFLNIKSNQSQLSRSILFIE